MTTALRFPASAIVDGRPLPSAPRRGLVIGAGAALGGAWALGVLCALHELEGYDPGAGDVVVGTSAGSVLAALIGCGVPLGEMVARLAGGTPRSRAPSRSTRWMWMITYTGRWATFRFPSPSPATCHWRGAPWAGPPDTP